MYQFFRLLTVRQFFARQVPTLAASLVVAEFFYKFHSFTLECGAFLATWFVFDAAVQGAVALARGGRQSGPKTVG